METLTDEVRNRARRTFQEAELRIQPPQAAWRLWTEIFTEAERAELGNDFIAAYKQTDRFATARMWALLHGVIAERAVVEVALQLGFLRAPDVRWLLRVMGELVETEDELAPLSNNGAIVLLLETRKVYWEGRAIEIDWHAHQKSWMFLETLCMKAKSGKAVDTFDFGDGARRNIVTQLKSRLTHLNDFPQSLADAIVPVGLGTQRLNLLAPKIRIFEPLPRGELREWHP